MEPRPIRMPDQLWEAIEEDAKRHNRMAAEHVREICRGYLEAETKNIRKKVDQLEERIERLERERAPGRGGTEREARTEAEAAGGNGATAARAEPQASPGETEAQSARGEAGDPAMAETEAMESPEPIEDIDDVLGKARTEYGEDEPMLNAGEEALRALREEGRVSKEELRSRLFEEYASAGESEEVWWSTTVQPVFQIAAKWGLVVVHDDEFEWIGPPEGEGSR